MQLIFSHRGLMITLCMLLYKCFDEIQKKQMFCIIKYGCLLFYLVVKKENNCTFPFLEKSNLWTRSYFFANWFTAFIILTEAFYGTVHSNNMLLSFSGTGINIYIQTLYSEVVLQFKIHMPLKYTGEFFTHFETEIQQFSNLLPDVQVFTVYFIVTWYWVHKVP